MNAFNEAFGRLLRERRMRLGMRQEDLGELVSLSRPSIINIEKGRQGVPLHTFVKLSDALQCRPTDLLPGGEPGESDLKSVLRGRPQREQQFVKDALRRSVEPTQEPDGSKA